MDVVTRAIALRATDYNENDKIVTLYSLEYGKISVRARGIRKNNAKLKFCADQFCFGNYELSKSSDDRFVLKTCKQMESFYSLREDVASYYAACVIAECLAVCTQDGQPDSDIFVETLKALQALTSEIEPLLVTLRFLLYFLAKEGFMLNLSECSVCAKPLSRAYWDSVAGNVVCADCRSTSNLALSARTVAICRLVNGLPYEKLSSLNYSRDVLKEALDLCSKHVSLSFAPLRSLVELRRL